MLNETFRSHRDADTASPETEANYRWYVIHTKKGKERAVQAMLKGSGIDTFLPLLVGKPFFRSYLFAHCDIEAVGENILNWGQGMSTHGGLVKIGDKDEPAVVSDEIIAKIRERAASPGPIDSRQMTFVVGDNVYIQELGLFGTVSTFKGPKVIVNVKTFNRDIPINVDPKHLEKI